jgi:hypothetical protein
VKTDVQPNKLLQLHLHLMCACHAEAAAAARGSMGLPVGVPVGLADCDQPEQFSCTSILLDSACCTVIHGYTEAIQVV